LQSHVEIYPGETALAFYTAKNPTEKPIDGIRSVEKTTKKLYLSKKAFILSVVYGSPLFFYLGSAKYLKVRLGFIIFFAFVNLGPSK